MPRRRERERLERQRRRTERPALAPLASSNLVALLALVLSGVAGFALAVPLGEIFLLRRTPLERLTVLGAASLSPMAIAARAGIDAGLPLDRVDPARVREALVADPWIDSARALRLPTGTLVLAVEERRALARWQADAAGEIELIDLQGRRFAGAVAPGGPLPLVRGAFDEDDRLSTSARGILDALARHPRLARDPMQVTLYLPERGADASGEGSGFALQIGDEGPRALLGRRALAQRVARLAALLESEAADVRRARWIDLRYADRAVLRTEPAPG